MKTKWHLSCDAQYCEIGRSDGMGYFMGRYEDGRRVHNAVDSIRVIADEVGGDGHYDDLLQIWTTDDNKQIESITFDYDGEPEASFRELDYDDVCEALQPLLEVIEKKLNSADLEEASRKTLAELKKYNPTMKDVDGVEYGIEEGNYWDYLLPEILELINNKTITVDIDAYKK